MKSLPQTIHAGTTKRIYRRLYRHRILGVVWMEDLLINRHQYSVCWQPRLACGIGYVDGWELEVLDETSPEILSAWPAISPSSLPFSLSMKSPHRISGSARLQTDGLPCTYLPLPLINVASPTRGRAAGSNPATGPWSKLSRSDIGRLTCRDTC